MGCCRLRDGVVFAHGCKVPDALTLVLNTKTCAVFMEGLACPLYCALPGLEGSGIRVGRPDQLVAKIHQLLKIAVRVAIVMRTGKTASLPVVF